MIKQLKPGSRFLLYIYFGLLTIYGFFSWQFLIFRQSSPVLLYMKFLLIPIGFLIIFANRSFVVSHFKALRGVVGISIYFFLMYLLKSTSLYQNVCLVWCTSFMIGYLLSHYTLSKDKSVSFWPLAYILFPVAVFFTLLHRGDFSYDSMVTNMDGNWIDNNVVMVNLSLLPFVLMRGKRSISNAAIFLVIACAIVSVKRTVLITTILILMVFLFYRITRKNRKHIFFKLSLFIIAIVGLFFLLKYLDTQMNGGELFDRLQHSNKDEDTSGRYGMYETYLFAIMSFSPKEFLFGTISMNSDFTGNVHNDLMYVAFHYGLVGIVLFLTIMVHIIGTSFRIVRSDCLGKDMSLSCLVAMITILVCGSFNCFITSDGYTYLMLFFGHAVGKYQLVQNNTKLNANNKYEKI